MLRLIQNECNSRIKFRYRFQLCNLITSNFDATNFIWYPMVYAGICTCMCIFITGHSSFLFFFFFFSHCQRTCEFNSSSKFQIPNFKWRYQNRRTIKLQRKFSWKKKQQEIKIARGAKGEKRKRKITLNWK